MTANGYYYEGDRANASDSPVSQRPDNQYVWANGAWQPDATAVLASFHSAVKTALADTDTTMLRIDEGVGLGLCSYSNPDVSAFIQYRRSLRALINASQVSAMPIKPSYPVGS